MLTTQDTQQLLTHLSTIAASISNVAMKLDYINSNLTTQSTATSKLAMILEDMKREHDVDRAEEKRSGREGVWEVQWFVEAPPRKPVQCPDEESAYEAARTIAANLAPGETINVFCTEVKRYQREDIPREAWDSKEK